MKRYSVSRRTKNPDTFTCLYCGKVQTWKHGNENKFCNLKCYNDYKWETVQIPLILEGKASALVVKKYLIFKYGNRCMVCEQSGEWNGKPLTIQLDHIDGNSDINTLENTRLLCPNCHSQTKTFCSKGAGNRYKKDTIRNNYLRKYKGYEE